MIDKNKLFEKVGSMDGQRLLDFFNKNNITDIEILDDEIKFTNLIKISTNELQSELTTLSCLGRAFPLTVKDDALYINVVIAAKSGLYRPSQPLGHLEEELLLPSIQSNACVLDIGAGSGYAAKKMRDEYQCDVYALEPCDERSTDYDNCVSKLGADHVEKLTLQEALRQHPEKYLQKFDVVTVFKYNIPFAQKEEFIHALAKTLKPDGVLYITSVENSRFNYKTTDKLLYLIDALKLAFDNVSVSHRGQDLLATCRGPIFVPEEPKPNKGGCSIS